MAISRVWIEDGCISCGVAEGICPEVFMLVDNSPDTVIQGTDRSSFLAEIRRGNDFSVNYNLLFCFPTL